MPRGLQDVPAIENTVFAVLIVVGNRVAPVTGQCVMRVMDRVGTGAMVVEVVGRSQGVDECLLHVGKAASPVTEHYAFSAVFVHDLLQLCCDVIQGFIPGHVSPLALTSLAVPDQRLLKPFTITLENLPCSPPRAEVSASDQIGITPDVLYLLVLHLNPRWGIEPCT